MDKLAFRNIQKKLGLTNEGVSEALDVGLFTVQMWACGSWPVPRSIAKFLRILLSMKRNNKIILNWVEDYTAGYDDGHNVGCEHCERSFRDGMACCNDNRHKVALKAGRAEIFNNGYRVALKAGHARGFNDGYVAAMKTMGVEE